LRAAFYNKDGEEKIRRRLEEKIRGRLEEEEEKKKE